MAHAHSVLVPHDGSSEAQAALQFALELVPDARIVLFHAIDPFEVRPDESGLPPATKEWLDEQEEVTATLLDEARSDVDAPDASIETATAVGSPAQTIVAAVDETAVDHIVMGSSGRAGAAGERLGSTAQLVVRRASVPVTVVR